MPWAVEERAEIASREMRRWEHHSAEDKFEKLPRQGGMRVWKHSVPINSLGIVADFHALFAGNHQHPGPGGNSARGPATGINPLASPGRGSAPESQHVATCHSGQP